MNLLIIGLILFKFQDMYICIGMCRFGKNKLIITKIIVLLLRYLAIMFIYVAYLVDNTDNLFKY